MGTDEPLPALTVWHLDRFFCPSTEPWTRNTSIMALYFYAEIKCIPCDLPLCDHNCRKMEQKLAAVVSMQLGLLDHY